MNIDDALAGRTNKISSLIIMTYNTEEHYKICGM